MPFVRRRTAAAPAVRCHCDTSEPARRRAAEAPLGAAAPTSTQGFLSSNGQASSAVAWRRLKAFSQHGALSRQPSRRKLTETSCRRQHRRSTSALLGAAADRTPPPRAGAPGTSTKDKPANDRASPRVAPVHLLRKGVWSPSATATAGGGGLFHSKPKNLSHASLACDSS